MVLETLPEWAWILFSVAVFIFFVCGGIISFIIMSRIRWPIIVTVLQDIPPYGPIPIKGDRARLVPFGDAGQEMYYLRKRKKYRVGHGKKIGLNKIAWVIDDAGLWYNCSFAQLNKSNLEIGIIPVDRDMLFANVTIRKGLEKRYDDRNFISKWGVPIAIGMLVIAMIVGGISNYYTLSKANQIAQSNGEAAKTNLEVIKVDKQVVDQLVALKSGGTILTSSS